MDALILKLMHASKPDFAEKVRLLNSYRTNPCSAWPWHALSSTLYRVSSHMPETSNKNNTQFSTVRTSQYQPTAINVKQSRTQTSQTASCQSMYPLRFFPPLLVEYVNDVLFENGKLPHLFYLASNCWPEIQQLAFTRLGKAWLRVSEECIDSKTS